MSKTANSQHLRESNHVPSEMSTNKAIEESQLSKRNIFLESNIPQNGQMSRYSSSQQNCLNSKHANEIKAINHTLTYCLNTQTQMAKALTEIGQYLKTMNESNSSAIRVPRRIPNTMVKTGQSDCISLPKAEDKTKLDVCLQVLIAKFEQMQTQLMAKLKELEMSQGSSSSPDSICQSTVDSNTKYDPNNHNKSKLIASIRAESGVNGSTYDKSGLNSKKDFNFGLNAPGKDQSKPKVDESMFSRSDNIHSSENSPDTKHNVPASDSEKIVVGRNFDRAYAVSGDFDNFTKIDFNTRKPKSTRDTNSVFTSPTSGMTARSSTNKVLPIVLKMRSNPVSYQEIKCNYLTSRGLENKEDQKYCSNLQSYRNSMRTESECVEIDQGVKENQLNSQGSQKRESKEDLIYYGSGAQTSRDIATGFFTPREYPRPQMSSLLKKEIIDESMENTLDKTVNMDKLMQGFDKKPLYETPWTAGLDNQNILNADTQRIARSQLLVAQKERDIIKLLMKDEYGEARPAYHKADYGSMYQKKYLINAKWWREWKDFVNFDAETEDSVNAPTDKGSFITARTYLRPGPINNVELLRRDVITDPTELAPELELKENLLEHHDYEAVNKKIHSALTAWYGSDFEICRVLKPDPFDSNKLYLELYPRKKIVKRQIPKSMDATNEKNYADKINKIINLNLKHTIK